MAEVSLSLEARLDLLSIIEYLTDVAGPQTARVYNTDFKRVVENLNEFTGRGTPRPHLGPETRVVSVNPYLIFYDGGPESETVQVLRIIHSHRNITPQMIARGRRS